MDQNIRVPRLVGHEALVLEVIFDDQGHAHILSKVWRKIFTLPDIMIYICYRLWIDSYYAERPL